MATMCKISARVFISPAAIQAIRRFRRFRKSPSFEFDRGAVLCAGSKDGGSQGTRRGWMSQGEIGWKDTRYRYLITVALTIELCIPIYGERYTIAIERRGIGAQFSSYLCFSFPFAARTIRRSQVSFFSSARLAVRLQTSLFLPPAQSLAPRRLSKDADLHGKTSESYFI